MPWPRRRCRYPEHVHARSCACPGKGAWGCHRFSSAWGASPCAFGGRSSRPGSCSPSVAGHCHRRSAGPSRRRSRSPARRRSRRSTSYSSACRSSAARARAWSSSRPAERRSPHRRMRSRRPASTSPSSTAWPASRVPWRCRHRGPPPHPRGSLRRSRAPAEWRSSPCNCASPPPTSTTPSSRRSRRPRNRPQPAGRRWRIRGWWRARQAVSIGRRSPAWGSRSSCWRSPSAPSWPRACRW